MARILGLDIGARTVKALLLESNLRGFAVRAYYEAPVDPSAGTADGAGQASSSGAGATVVTAIPAPAGSAAAGAAAAPAPASGPWPGLAAALSALQAGKQLAADQVVVAVPGAAVAMHLLTLPFTDPRRIESTIAFEVEGQLPYDLADVVFDYQVLSQHDGKSDILVGAVKKEDLTRLLETLKAAGVDPRVVTTSALAYQSVLAGALTGYSGAPPAGNTVEAIVDIGHERTSVCVGRSGGGIEYARAFSGGGKELTRAIAAEFKVTLKDAEAWKDNEGDVTLGPDVPPENEKAAAALLRGLAPIIREIRSTLRAHSAKSHKEVGRIYLTGGTSRLKGLGPLLSRELGTEVVPLEAVPQAGSPVPPERAPMASQAFALAQRGHGGARSAKFNLRKGELAFKGDLDYLKGKVGRLAAFAGVLVVLSLGLVWARFHVLQKAEGELDKTLCTTTTRVVGSCQKDYLVALSLLKGKGSVAAALPVYSAVDLFAEVTARTQNLTVKIDDMNVQLERVQLHGETDSFDGVDQVVSSLKSFKCFQEIKRGKVQKSKDGTKVTFDLDIRVQCGEAPKEGV
ncbi:MAG TPA: type II secretion system protein GspL [Myxococcales bacterium]|jgi:general secretion pathway protein L